MWDLSIIHIKIKVEDVTPKFKAVVDERPKSYELNYGLTPHGGSKGRQNCAVEEHRRNEYSRTS